MSRSTLVLLSNFARVSDDFTFVGVIQEKVFFVVFVSDQFDGF